MLETCGFIGARCQQPAKSDPLAGTALNLVACLEPFSARQARLHSAAPRLSIGVRHLGPAGFPDALSVDTKQLMLTELAFALFTELELC